MPVKKYPHILLKNRSLERSYTPKGRPVTLPPDIPFFDQQSHAADLDQAYKAALNSLAAQYRSHGLDPASVDKGVAIEFQFRAGTKIDVATLEDAHGKKIEVLNVKLDQQGNPESAILYIPPERKQFIQSQINAYGDPSKNGKSGPKNYKKYDKTTSIEPIQIGKFWIDRLPLPQDTTKICIWEVWLREEQFETFKAKAHELGDIDVSAHHLKFPERQICSVRCSLESLEKIELMTKAITGFRFLWTQAGFFDALTPREQRDWSDELSSRLTFNPDTEYSVCVLDTGLAVNHPLLKPAIAKNGVDSCNPQNWGSDDHHGHGTAMAGIALFGDLTPLLESTETIGIGHLVESVKVFPPEGKNENEHIGYITAQAVGRAEINRPDLKRVFCLSWTIRHEVPTKNIQVTEGKPTPLSAKIDQLAFGVDEEDWRINDARKRLLIVSAGNIEEHFHPNDYPSVNNLYEIEDPAQAWNALSVGAYTEKIYTTDPTYNGWSVLAGIGQLSPKSRTSVLWGESYWPIKPDIVLEGGNCLANGSYFEDHPDICPLTTDKERIFSHTGDTSAANAEAARLATILASQYPAFWPESIRGLLVHSAEWTPGMLNERSFKNKARKIAHLRRYGYGVPQQNFLMNSFSNRPCVIIQDYLQPFSQSKSGSNIVFNDMNYYILPWPKEKLEAIVDQVVKLRVTLSYFIEPSPSERPPKTKYSYASHELRFKINRPNESEDVFLARINKELQIEEINEELSGEYEISDQTAVDEQDKWLLGPESRNRGSLISDIWQGTGPELATQNLIAVVPQVGWWKFRKNFPDADNGRYNQRVRYSLILSLICETEVDLYTPITQEIETPIQIIV